MLDEMRKSLMSPQGLIEILVGMLQ